MKRGVDNRTSDPALHVDLRAPRAVDGKRPSRPVSWPSAGGAASTPAHQVIEELIEDGQERVKRLHNAGTFSQVDPDELDSGILFGRTSRATGSPALSERSMPATPRQDLMIPETSQNVSDVSMDVDSPVDMLPQAPVDQAPVEQESLQHEQPETDENAAFWAKATVLGIKPEQVCYYVRHHNSVLVVDQEA